MVSSFHGFFSSSDSPSSLLILRRSCHTLFNWMASLQYDSLHESSPHVKKLLSHLVHFNGCFLHGSSDISLSLFEKILPHLMHLYGFSPVWFLSWIVTWCGKAPETWMVSFLHGPSEGTLSILILRSSCHTLCNWMSSIQCDSLPESSPDVENLLRLKWFFPS